MELLNYNKYLKTALAAEKLLVSLDEDMRDLGDKEDGRTDRLGGGMDVGRLCD